ncbi:MAG: TonB-dependent receptor, partial [Bacteroidaceae bacterium]|nr:TonB-dependent receptor [Bacteroidaceae bacterium]
MNKFTLLIAALTCQGAAFAQIHRMERQDTSAVVRTYELNPIVVTGSGHHQRLAATTTPVRSLSAKEMAEQGITTLDAALTRMVPSLSMAPSSMGSFLRMNGLSGKYILILINGQKLSGDISNNLELARVDLSRVKRIEVLDGAASSLYGSDAIAGVINIITDQPTSQLVGVTSNTRIADNGIFTESVNLDVYTHGFGSYTTYSHDRADSYRNNPLEYDKGSDTETHETIAPLFTGYRTNNLSQRFTYSPTGVGPSANRYTINATIDYFNKTTDRPDTRTDITGGTDYEMAYRGLRWGAGGIYKFSSRNSLQADFTSDYFRYGRRYDVETSSYSPGDFVRSKRQHSNEVQLKAIMGLTAKSTTVVGADWRRDRLTASSGNIDESAYIMAAYAQHEMNFMRQFTASVGARLDYHETFHAHLTPKAALMYSPGNFRLRATYSQGFRAPGLDEIFYHYYAVSRGKPQIIFGNHDLRPERSHYWALSAEYRNDVVAATVTAYINRVSDMVVRQDIPTDASNMAMLRSEFPEMTDAEAAKLERYSLYRNSDRGDVKGIQASLSVTPMA